MNELLHQVGISGQFQCNSSRPTWS